MTLPAETTGVVQEAGTAVLSCLRQQAQGTLTPAGEVRLEGGPAALASVRGQLLQVAPMEGHDWRVRRFTVPADCPGTPLVPEQEARLRGAVVEGVARSGWTIAADTERPELLLGEAYYQGPSTPSRLILTWLSGEALDTVASGELSGSSGQFTALALARERALVIENRRQVYVLERDGERLRILAHVDLTASERPLEVSRILAFDGEVAWLGVSSRPLGVVALRASDLARVARHETPGLVRSLAFTGGRLVLGMNNGLVLTEPVDVPQP
jgi:hypothetical protein